jgi:hypothetical protein
LQDKLVGTVQTLRAWSAQWLRTLGSTDAERECRLILDLLDGIMLHQLAFPDPAFDPHREITTLVRAVVSVR